LAEIHFREGKLVRKERTIEKKETEKSNLAIMIFEFICEKSGLNKDILLQQDVFAYIYNIA
jgi:AMMECR1 domain-containing protein